MPRNVAMTSPRGIGSQLNLTIQPTILRPEEKARIISRCGPSILYSYDLIPYSLPLNRFAQVLGVIVHLHEGEPQRSADAAHTKGADQVDTTDQ